MMIGIARHNLHAVARNLHFFADRDLLFGCVKTPFAPGHTPGHPITEIELREEKLINMGDLANDAALLFAHPEWGNTLDTNFEMVALDRKQVLGELPESRVSVFSYHLPWPGIGNIRRRDGGFESVAQLFASPEA